MESLADKLPPEVAQYIHPDWRKNEAEYWACREALLRDYQRNSEAKRPNSALFWRSDASF